MLIRTIFVNPVTNDVPECVSSKIRLYADDVLLYREIETREDCIKLQMDLDALQNWKKYMEKLINALYSS